MADFVKTFGGDPNMADFTFDYIVNLSVTAQQKLAEIHNAATQSIFEVAVQNALSNGATPPTSYKVEVVHPEAILATYQAGWPYVGFDKWTSQVDFFPPMPVVPPPLPVPTSPVGGPEGNGWFFDNGLPGYADGSTFTDSRGTFKKTDKQTPFGRSVGWQKTA